MCSGLIIIDCAILIDVEYIELLSDAFLHLVVFCIESGMFSNVSRSNFPQLNVQVSCKQPEFLLRNLTIAVLVSRLKPLI